MKQIPIKFVKPKRGKGSCATVLIEINRGVAACLSTAHSSDWSADGSNGVLVIEDAESSNDMETHKG